MKKIINTEKSPAPIGPYNQAILKDNILFISGQIALDPISMKLNNDSIENETNQVMMNLKIS
jgi:2-iminobutanoate/2-iminopropanoate deaminase